MRNMATGSSSSTVEILGVPIISSDGKFPLMTSLTIVWSCWPRPPHFADQVFASGTTDQESRLGPSLIAVRNFQPC